MTEGDVYPHLRHARFDSTTMEMRTWAPQDLLRIQNVGLDHYDITSVRVPAVQITLPQADWSAIMEIYSAHYHAASRHPSVQAAWEQYRMMVTLTRHA